MQFENKEQNGTNKETNRTNKEMGKNKDQGHCFCHIKNKQWLANLELTCPTFKQNKKQSLTAFLKNNNYSKKLSHIPLKNYFSKLGAAVLLKIGLHYRCFIVLFW